MTLHLLSHLITGCRESDDIVAWQSGKAIPYEQFLKDVRCVANTFSAHSAAALACYDSYNFMIGFFGLLCVGARLVLPPSNETAALETFRDRFETLIDDVAIENACRGQMGINLDPVEPTLPVIDFFTSGSTGTPKCVTKSLAMFDRELAVFEKLYGCAIGAGKVFATVPHQHVYGITFKLLWPLATGRAFTAETHALWEPLWSEIIASSIIISSPAHLSRLTGLETLPAHRRPKLVLSAGAPLTRTASDEAVANLGYYYQHGVGVIQNYGIAVSWYLKAAEQGLAEAQNNLGVMYAQGKGVEKNEDRAIEWYQMADAGGRLNPSWAGWLGPNPRNKLSSRSIAL